MPAHHLKVTENYLHLLTSLDFGEKQEQEKKLVGTGSHTLTEDQISKTQMLAWALIINLTKA